MILARWSRLQNWGDALNPVLIKLISGQEVEWVPTPSRRRWFRKRMRKPVYVVVGSTLRYAVDEETIIWGAGFRAIDDHMRHKPARVCAVRGPLTRMKLQSFGVRCPDVFGDPALLFPRFYQPKVEKRFELGIVPHFTDKNSQAVQKLAKEPGIAIIDIEGDIHAVVDSICSCARIASSSLHGLIVADAYGIESSWIEFSGNVVGEGFKFADYFAGVGRPFCTPLFVDATTGIGDIVKTFRRHEFSPGLDRLLDACPFRAGAPVK